MGKLGFEIGALMMCVMVLLQKSDGTQFIVGGAKGWGIQNYNQWAEANRFQIGDSLVFNYGGDEDSVVQVTEEDYTNCSIESPIKVYSDGHTVFQFDKSGPYYFISGNKHNCLQNEKLLVVVLADRTNSTSNHTTILPPPPSPSPSTDITPSPSPSPSPSTDITPSPAPGNDQIGAPSPSPSGSTEINPSPPPSEETIPSPPPAEEEAPSPPPGTIEISPAPPVSGPRLSFGSSIIPSSIGSIGAFVATVILAF